MAKEGRFGAQNAPASQTLIVSSRDPETIFVPIGENATDMTQWLWALLFSALSSSVAAREGRNGQIWPTRGDLGQKRAPASQTLIVLSYEPDTIVFPSGENATEATGLLCALDFSLISSSVPAREARDHQVWPRKGGLGPQNAPASQTLIVPETPPDTIFVPSGENCTELMP